MEQTKTVKVFTITDASYEDKVKGHVEARYIGLYGEETNYDSTKSRLPNMFNHYYIAGEDVKKFNIGSTVKITFTIED
jgi:hypothetical protein